jgi:hypothetical protein
MYHFHNRMCTIRCLHNEGTQTKYTLTDETLHRGVTQIMYAFTIRYLQHGSTGTKCLLIFKSRHSRCTITMYQFHNRMFTHAINWSKPITIRSLHNRNTTNTYRMKIVFLHKGEARYQGYRSIITIAYNTHRVECMKAGKQTTKHNKNN